MDTATATVSELRSVRPSALRSRPAQRAAERETELCIGTIDAVFASRSHSELSDRLLTSVWGTKAFERLPKYRKSYIEGYRDGALDAASRIYGQPISKIPPAPHVRVPQWVQELQPDAHWHRHPHGGGWVSHTAYVEHTVYLGPEAAVYDSARALGSTRIYGPSRVCQQAEVYGAAHLRAGAVVGGDAQVSGRVRVIRAKLFAGRYTGEAVIRSSEEAAVLAATPPSTSTLPPPAFVSSAPPRSTYFTELRPA